MPPVLQALPRPTRELIAGALQTLLGHLAHVSNTLFSGLDAPVSVPPELARLMGATEDLRRGVLESRDDLPVEFAVEQLAILRTGLAVHRRAVAERVEATQGRLATPEQIGSAKKVLEPLDSILDSPFLDRVNSHPLPRLATYLTPHGRQGLAHKPELSPEETDPKHRILLSASLIAHDITTYRRHCEDRRLPFAIVYADVDNFKDFNTAKGEVYVDRFVLPPILNAVEAACYGHGRAYRHGGDEFVLLLPNATQTLALNVASQLARSVAELRLEGLPHQPHLSVGIWITHPESHLTSTELVDAAATAKRNSKQLGKSRITIRVETHHTTRKPFTRSRPRSTIPGRGTRVDPCVSPERARGRF